MEKVQFDSEYLEIVQDLPNSLEEYQYWLGLKERKIYFNSEVDLSIVNKVVYWIMRWNEEDNHHNIPIDHRKTIELYLTTNGGCVISGFSLVDAITASKTPISTIGVGICASMGAILLLSGTKGYRKCFHNTTILLHDGNLSLSHSGKKARQVMGYYEGLEERIKQLVLTKTMISEDVYDEKSSDEWYMFGDQALTLGIVDEIIS